MPALVIDYGDEETPLLPQDTPTMVERDAEFGGTIERAKLEKALLRKLDARMSILVLIYILNYIDRTNLATARLRGFESDLGLKGQEFASLLSILYAGYILMQIPSNMYLNYTGRPSLYLPAAMTLWGSLTLATGFVHNFTGALLARFFLGFVEGKHSTAFFPGALFLLSSWYRREELGLRMAILFCGSMISNAFGGLLAAGILDTMEGKLGYAAWRWLFFIEGAMTISVAICSIFILPDFPSNTRWLTPLERRLAEKRIAEDVGILREDEKQGPMQGLKMAVTDWKVWWLALTLTSFVVGLSFFAYFPTLAATLGYSRTITLLLCAPPWAFATLVAFVNARHSDRTRERFFHIAIPITVGIIGLFIALATMNTAARYVSLFLMAQSNAGFVVFLGWASNSIPNPPAKRAVALALINMVSQVGNISGSYVFPTAWGPTYRKSYAICIANFSICILMSFIFRKYLISLNERMDRGEDLGFGVETCRLPVEVSTAGADAVSAQVGGNDETLDTVEHLPRLSRAGSSSQRKGKDITERQGFRYVY
ncbi:hypothetical protein BOTBODRAFT_179347 [Botryobasidium botryosum FD-172 SS1]|uniref:Major facilitator superfamily (MFS) profile domain-containing protein n=1 Tax=Botryobasidium botryosum (strain FD-172 SS1) TaxID=930990 RepID=A0A067M2R6_BOTB1|nr:hypothetical protein BOTBODRAFT_179347 [Botryobasidium botryosum FD-172 SS1]